MPTLKTKIFNSEIDIKYETKDKEKLLQLIAHLKLSIEKYLHLSGKASDNKIIILAAIAAQDELNEQKILQSKEILTLKDRIFELENQLNKLKIKDNKIQNEIDTINEKLETFNNSILSVYDE
tara:strand:+ start:100 stop:468 length:369 start_codon:yes stop_codon:yes gene_type:complete